MRLGEDGHESWSGMKLSRVELLILAVAYRLELLQLCFSSARVQSMTDEWNNGLSGRAMSLWMVLKLSFLDFL